MYGVIGTFIDRQLSALVMVKAGWIKKPKREN